MLWPLKDVAQTLLNPEQVIALVASLVNHKYLDTQSSDRDLTRIDFYVNKTTRQINHVFVRSEVIS